MSTFNTFGPIMQNMLADSVEGALGYLNDIKLDIIRDDEDDFMETFNPSLVLRNSVTFLAQQLDPEFNNEDLVTPQMRKALREIILKRISFYLM